MACEQLRLPYRACSSNLVFIVSTINSFLLSCLKETYSDSHAADVRLVCSTDIPVISREVFIVIEFAILSTLVTEAVTALNDTPCCTSPNLGKDTATPCSSLSHMIPGLGGEVVSAAFGASFLKL